MSKGYKVCIKLYYRGIVQYRFTVRLQTQSSPSRLAACWLLQPASNQEIASTAWTYVMPPSERNEQQMYKNERKQSPIISINRLFVSFYRFVLLLSVYRFSIIGVTESPWKQHHWSSVCSSLFKDGMRSSSTTRPLQPFLLFLISVFMSCTTL